MIDPPILVHVCLVKSLQTIFQHYWLIPYHVHGGTLHMDWTSHASDEHGEPIQTTTPSEHRLIINPIPS